MTMNPIEITFEKLARSTRNDPLLAHHYQQIEAAYSDRDFAKLTALLETGIQPFNGSQPGSPRRKTSVYVENLTALKAHFICADDSDKEKRSYHLMRAINLEDVQALKQSIENQGGLAIINTPSKPLPSSNEKLTPLQQALRTKNLAIILLLASFLDKTALEAPLNASGETLFHFAAMNGWQDVVVLLLSKNVSLDPKRTIDEATPLHLASRYGHQAVAQLLINRGADIHAKCKVDTKAGFIETSVLSSAIYSSSAALVTALLAQGVPVDELAYGLAKKSAKNNSSASQTIYSQVIQPFKEQKNNIIKRGSVKEKLGEKIQIFHPIVQQILSQVYTEDSKNDEFIAKKLNEIILSNNEILKPLLYIIAWATQGLHGNSKKPLQIVIADTRDITSLKPIEYAKGNYNQKNSIYCAGKDPDTLIASMLHEAQHFIDKLIFGQSNKPFNTVNQSHFLQVKDDVLRRSSALPERTPQDKLLKQSFLTAHASNYKELDQTAEILVKVPEVIGLMGMEKGYVWLNQYQPALLAYYEHRYNRTARAFIAEHDIIEKLNTDLPVRTSCHELSDKASHPTSIYNPLEKRLK